MKSLRKSFLILPLLWLITTAHAAPVALNDWTETGRVGNNTFTGNGTAGFTELFGGPYVRPVQGDTVNDTGAMATFVSPVTLNSTANQLRFGFTVANILATGAGTPAVGSNNAFRVGFENDPAGSVNDSTMHYQFGYGPTNRRDTRFAGTSGSNNEYSQGTATPSLTLTGATPLMTGNTSNITVTLTYLGDAGGGNHNYRAEIDWDGQIHTNSTIVRNTDTWDKIYVVSDQGNVNVANDTYTVSNVQVTTASIDLSAIGLKNWLETGRDVNNTFTGNTTDGFKETFGNAAVGIYDSGAQADFVNDVLFSEPFEALEFSLTAGDIIATGGTNGGLRIGFENDGANSATIHYAFGYGIPGDTPASSRRDARFAGDSFSNNEYAFGTTFDINFEVGPPASLLSTGNTANIAVTLIYLGDAGGGLYNYQATINWDGAKHTSSVFTRNTNTWDKVYVVSNSNLVNLPGDTYTISNAQVRRVTISPSDYDDWAGPSGFDLSGGPNDDEEEDGRTNFEEYAFGLDPTDPSSLSPIVAPLSSTTGLFQYTRRNPTLRETGLTYTYQYSTTLELNSWMFFTPDVNPPATNSGDPVETVTVDLPDALLAEPRLFVRVLAQ